MYTSIALFALTASVATSYPQEGLTWQQSYAQAQKVGQTENKPLAVFLGSGTEGYDKVSRDGQLSDGLKKLLADNYVCVYVDVSTPAGKKLAGQFGIRSGMGLVLSDRTGNLQAFFHDGDLTEADLMRWVDFFSDPNVVVTTTKTNTASQVSLYPPTNGTNGVSNTVGRYTYGQVPATGYYSRPVYYGGGGCPGGRCGR